MSILIDGYNLLHATGILSRSVGPGSLERLHAEFLDFLAARLVPRQIGQTAIVFDAKGRRANTRRMLSYAGFTVHYSSRDEEADHLLEELIDQHRDPRHLVVVSSDHQVQRSARRRGAKPIDSELWWRELLQSWRQRQQAESYAAEAKPATSAAIEEAAWWLSQFDDDLLAALHRDEAATKRRLPPPSPAPPVKAAPASPPESSPPTDSPPSPRKRASKGKPAPIVPVDEDRDAHRSLHQPFPRSYLEEIEQELLAEFDALKPPPAPPRKPWRR